MEKLYVFGAGLITLSIPFTLASYLILGSIPLTALGIGLIILASSILLTPTQSIPPQAIRAMLESSILSLEALLEEFDISRRCYYVRAPDGRIYAYVPLREEAKPPEEATPTGLINRKNGFEYLTLIPPASELVKAPEISGSSFESALTYVLVDLVEIADSLDVITNGFITVKLKGVKSHVSAGRFKAIFGSLEASIIACIAANLLGPTRIIDEIEEGEDKIIILEVLTR